jgi:hypothetical protein
MNLEQSLSLAALGTSNNKQVEKQELTALQMARRVFKVSAAAGSPYRNITPEEWARKWLSSPRFVLTQVETDKVALIRTPRNVNKVLADMQASQDSLEPAVIDLNKNKLGAKNGYVPRVVAVDGAHRAYGQYLQGRDLMKAWVGVKALDKVRPEPLLEIASISRIQASSNGNGTKVTSAAQLYAAQGIANVPRQDVGEGGSQPNMRSSTAMKSNSPGGSQFIKDRGVKAHGKGCDCSACSKKMEAMGGGPGASLGNGSGANPNMKASVPAARSSGHLEEPDPSDTDVPPNPSDTKPTVDPSDQLQYSEEPQPYPPGVKEDKNSFASPVASPGSGVGPRLKPSKGASNSEMQRKLEAETDMCAECHGNKKMKSAGKKIKRIWTDKRTKTKL